MRAIALSVLMALASINQDELLPESARYGKDGTCVTLIESVDPTRNMVCAGAPLSLFIAFVNLSQRQKLVSPTTLPNWNCTIKGSFHRENLPEIRRSLLHEYGLTTVEQAHGEQLLLVAMDRCIDALPQPKGCALGYLPSKGEYVACDDAPVQMAVDLCNPQSEWSISLPLIPDTDRYRVSGSIECSADWLEHSLIAMFGLVESARLRMERVIVLKWPND